MLNLHEATQLIYRPRRYHLPTGEVVNSLGEDWVEEPDNFDDDNLIYEKVSVAMTDDLTIGDAINFFTIHEAPYRPYLTYRARCAMEGRLISGEPTIVRSGGVSPSGDLKDPRRRSGRLRTNQPPEIPDKRTPFGPKGHNHQRIGDDPGKPDSEDPS